MIKQWEHIQVQVAHLHARSTDNQPTKTHNLLIHDNVKDTQRKSNTQGQDSFGGIFLVKLWPKSRSQALILRREKEIQRHSGD